MSQLKGSWPGGPSRREAGPHGRRTSDDREGRRADLPSVAEQSERAVATRHRLRARRRRRIYVGLVLTSAVVALVGGYLLGLQAHTSTEELTAQRMQAYQDQRQEQGVGGLMARESSRVIQQMWLTELMEGGGGR